MQAARADYKHMPCVLTTEVIDDDPSEDSGNRPVQPNHDGGVTSTLRADKNDSDHVPCVLITEMDDDAEDNRND